MTGDRKHQCDEGPPDCFRNCHMCSSDDSNTATIWPRPLTGQLVSTLAVVHRVESPVCAQLDQPLMLHAGCVSATNKFKTTLSHLPSLQPQTSHPCEGVWQQRGGSSPMRVPSCRDGGVRRCPAGVPGAIRSEVHNKQNYHVNLSWKPSLASKGTCCCCVCLISPRGYGSPPPRLAARCSKANSPTT